MQKYSMWKPEIDKKMSTKLHQWRDSKKKHNIQGDIETLLGKDCELEKIMRFFKGIGMFVEIET